MGRKIASVFAALALFFGIGLANISPAQASEGWYTQYASCSVDASHGMTAQLQFYNWAGDSQYFGRFIVNAPGATEIRASLRRPDGSIVDGPRVGYQNFDFTWGYTFPKSYDYRVRVYYYYGTGCNVVLNPPS